MNDLISIIVPVYNVKLYMAHCIDSILYQTYRNIEIILVDDGSTDGSAEICDWYSHKDSRIVVIHKKNGGLSDARNEGIRRAKGSLFVFVDSDDYIHRQMVEILYMVLIKTGSRLAICDYIKTVKNQEEKEDIKLDINKLKYKVLCEEDSRDPYYNKAKEDRFVVSWNKLYYSDLFKDIMFPIGKKHEDLFVAHELLYKASKIVFIDAELYFYRQNPDSIMGQGINITSLHMLEAYEEKMEFFYQRNEFYLYTFSFQQYKYSLLTLINELSMKSKQLKLKEFNHYIKTYQKQVIKRSKDMEINVKKKSINLFFALLPKLYISLYFLKKRKEL